MLVLVNCNGKILLILFRRWPPSLVCIVSDLQLFRLSDALVAFTLAAAQSATGAAGDERPALY